MKRIITLLAAVALLSSLPGCCCLWPHGCGNPCNPCNTGCGVGGGPVYVPQGTHQSYDAVSGLPASTTTAFQSAPAMSLGPLEALPTYR